MNNEVLNLILNRLDSIDSSLQELHIGQIHIKEEQQAMKMEQQSMKKEQQTMKVEQQAMRKEQQAMKVEQQAMRKEQQSIKVEQQAMRKEQQAINEDIKGIHHTNKWLRDDIETIYILQQENHKLSLEHEKLLNKSIEQLNFLIALASDNKYEHASFEKRISRLEALN